MLVCGLVQKTDSLFTLLRMPFLHEIEVQTLISRFLASIAGNPVSDSSVIIHQTVPANDQIKK
jgi:hypothetical protein